MSYDVSLESRSELGPKWGWFLALGIVFFIAGVVAAANLLIATAVSVYYIGALMVIGGAAQLVHAFQIKGWRGTLFWTVSGVLYLVAGVLAFINPLLTSMVLTLLLAFALITAGVVRILAGFNLKPMPGWGWMVFAGIITTLAGILIAVSWPANSLFMLGAFLAVDLVFQGISLISFSFLLKKLA